MPADSRPRVEPGPGPIPSPDADADTHPDTGADPELLSPSHWEADFHSPLTPSRPANPIPAIELTPIPAAAPSSPPKHSTTWTSEGPGHRVGYAEKSSIDWVFEYTKERHRLRNLVSRGAAAAASTSTTTWAGYLRRLADSSQIWVVLIATGIAAGTVAAFIDVVGGWLADLKTGVCTDVDSGGRFYLSLGFCCWGHDSLANCHDWRAWSAVFGMSPTAPARWIPDYFMFCTFTVLFAVAASLLVRNYATYAKHSGIPEIKAVLGGLVMRDFVGPWTLLIKTLGLCLSFASGLWLGKEGPLVHVACCFADLFSKLSPAIRNNEARKREVFSAASAAGFSAAFGSPIGGVLFSLEQLSYYFPDTTMWQSFVTAMIGAVTLQFLNPFRTGKLVLYQVTYHHGWHGFEIVPYACLGLLGGLQGGLFIRLNMKIARLRARYRTSSNSRFGIVEVFAIALVTGLVSFPIKFMRVQATELLYILFAECADITVDDSFGLCKSRVANTAVIGPLLITAFLGFFLAAVTFGSLIPAGILLPSMALGALYGRAVGLFVSLVQSSYPSAFIFSACEVDGPCVRPGTYAIIGAASALAGTTRMVISVVVIMFELTGALTYALPIMIAAIISKWVGDAVSRTGIYEAWIRANGYPLLDNRDDDWTGDVPDVLASDVMAPIEDLIVLSATGHTIESLAAMLDAHPYRGFPVVEPGSSSSTPAPVSTMIDRSQAQLVGYIPRLELGAALAVNMPGSTEVSFLSPVSENNNNNNTSSTPDSSNPPLLNLHKWVDHTAITLDAKSSFQLTVNMFQKLGLRYVLFVDRGLLRGLMTKKDVWVVLNEPDGPDGLDGPEWGVNSDEATMSGEMATGERSSSALRLIWSAIRDRLSSSGSGNHAQSRSRSGYAPVPAGTVPPTPFSPSSSFSSTSGPAVVDKRGATKDRIRALRAEKVGLSRAGSPVSTAATTPTTAGVGSPSGVGSGRRGTFGDAGVPRDGA